MAYSRDTGGGYVCVACLARGRDRARGRAWWVSVAGVGGHGLVTVCWWIVCFDLGGLVFWCDGLSGCGTDDRS